ncbi:hypothetical protein A0H81_05322 [Grifola frondosa]|uniref:Uncharacterized protein n=1 Tax=Grifola frondosa TaxID=5627 RepID=A0A1C7MD99_GRIFR|nr:hypothetical protein A0H81_05322 [Grifola frondosa]
MPGPRNAKKKRQAQSNKERRAKGRQSLDAHTQPRSSTSPSPSPPLATPPPAPNIPVTPEKMPNVHSIYAQEDDVPVSLQTPFIEDPGNGPRVRNTRAFLASSFAAPPSLDDPMCAEFAQEEVLQMLCSVLPEETAMILWYNKSRSVARICPACQRMYRLGDMLQGHLHDEENSHQVHTSPSPSLHKEQQLSGLCSPVCFILAAYNYPGAIRSTWGRMAEELDDETWDLLDGPGTQVEDMGLGMLLKMTRCHDLGLGQLFFPNLDLDSDGSSDEETWDEGFAPPEERSLRA